MGMATKPSWWMLLASIVPGLLLPWPHAAAQSDAQWTVFTDGEGTSVQYPSDVFPIEGGEAFPPGSVFTTRDGRARLHVFTVRNERDESPGQFMKREFTGDRRQLDYDRVASTFFAVSANKGDRILYRRCNFSNRLIHCIDLNYPRREERSWDGIVTRISLSLRPR
jgi:hypothetical protein